MKYEIRFFSGDYTPRQAAANAWGALCYVEQHCNSTDSPSVDYTCAVIARQSAGGAKYSASFAFARRWSELTARAWGIRDVGVKPGGFDGRGEGNVRVFKGPAILLEPCFGSNPRSSARLKSAEGQELLAQMLAQTIRERFPAGGKIAFSIGHKGRPSRPYDSGTELHGGGWEIEVSEKILRRAEAILTTPQVLEVTLPDGSRFSPTFERGRTLIVPARPLGEALGVPVVWDAAKRAVVVGKSELERVAPPDAESAKIGAWVRLDELAWALGLELVRDTATGQVKLEP